MSSSEPIAETWARCRLRALRAVATTYCLAFRTPLPDRPPFEWRTFDIRFRTNEVIVHCDGELVEAVALDFLAPGTFA